MTLEGRREAVRMRSTEMSVAVGTKRDTRLLKRLLRYSASIDEYVLISRRPLSWFFI